MKHFLTCFLALIVMNCRAQDETVKKLKGESETGIKKDVADTTQLRWKKGGLISLNIAQGSLSNWAAGGEDFSLAVGFLFNYYAFYKNGRHSWDNNIDLMVGYLKTTSLGSRKNDDRFDILSKYGYALTDKLSLAGLINFRTQMFKGYSFTSDGKKTLTSAFFSPAYLLISPGLDWKPNKDLSIFISPLSARWTFVMDDSLSAKGYYGVDPGKKSRNEIGAFLSINYLKEFNKVLAYKGRLDLFSNYKKNPQNIDLFMTNLVSLKISKAFSATWSLDLIYDDDVRLFGTYGKSPGLQVKSLVGIGILWRY
jgi:DUF3078 family protein